ncbi:O-antigen ligase family protein [Helicobacter sp. MIT 14-3879]|uniref:O-antigen ligase family protein n=1 Tax=Helicobacter sp. MIT 14-3879 TaxID=2040649 RepID=UPI000E1FA355|nr:O-antigen ligase family protein [Helicobacter sp. MIT 14-3879]RDU63119.1 hypothetical protein CQA44_05610 [Helicobacter sp. MIT 14-3879]
MFKKSYIGNGILDFIKTNNEKIALILFCIGLFILSIGLSAIESDAFILRVQTLFHIGGVLFILCNYKKFCKDDFKILFIPTLCCIVLVILGMLTYFDTIMPPKSFGSLFKSINQHIIGYFAFFILCYFFARYAKREIIIILLTFFGIVCFMNVFAMIYLAIKYGFYHNTFHYNIPFFFPGISVYNIWIIAPLSISIAGIWAFKNIKIKFLFIITLILSILAMLSNGERSFFIAFIVIIFTPFFMWQYKHKIKILGILFIFLVLLFCLIYHISKDLPPRYDIAHMIDNISTVWDTAPIEMGKYDEFCFNGKLNCSKESIQNGISNITWEHSSLSRIAMNKSTLLAFLDEPFKPHITNIFAISPYLYNYFNLNNSNNKVYFNAKGDIYKDIIDDYNGYNHPHNHILSLLFMYGAIGFIFIVLSTVYMIYSGYRAIKLFNNRFLALIFCLMIIGIFICSLFDMLRSIMLEPLSIIFGILLGSLYNKQIYK